MYDLAIIGGGPAGYSASFEAKKFGLNVIMFEMQQLGGTCLNRGCVPTKFLLQTAMKESTRNCSIDFEEISHRMKHVIEELHDGLIQQVKLNEIKLINGQAEIVDSHHVFCNGEMFETDNILIATGSVPKEPIFEKALSSDELLQMSTLPDAIDIIGGGVVAVEFAYIFSRLGVEVSVYFRGDRLLRNWDKELAMSIAQNLKNSGVKLHSKIDFSTWKAERDHVILNAIGRRASNHAFRNVKVDLDQDGAVITDRNGKTSLDHIFAAGDVISESAELAHIAMEQGKRIVRYIATGKEERQSEIAKCIYIKPEVVSIGLTEQEAKNKGIEIVLGKQTTYSNAVALIKESARGFVKIIVEKDTHIILGAQIMNDCATEMTGELLLAIDQRMTVGNLKRIILPHPSISEMLIGALENVERKLYEL